MIKNELQIQINAPVETVFARFTDPLNMIEDVAACVDVKDIVGEGEGMSYTIIYKMAGVRLTSKCTDVEVIPNRRIVSRSEGGIVSTITLELKSANAGCLFKASCEYEIPIPLVGKLAETLLKKMNQREWQAWADNLKVRFEAETVESVS